MKLRVMPFKVQWTAWLVRQWTERRVIWPVVPRWAIRPVIWLPPMPQWTAALMRLPELLVERVLMQLVLIWQHPTTVALPVHWALR